MHDFIQYGLLGIATGAIYAMLGNGMVVIYRGSGILNFAQGAFAMFGAYFYYELFQNHGWSFWPAFLVSVVASCLLGVCTQQFIMRPLASASPLARLVATLGVVGILQGLATIRYGSSLTIVNSTLPDGLWHIGSVVVPQNSIYLLIIAAGVTGVLYGASRYTTVGIASRAVAENPQSAAILGWSPDGMATLAWSVGGALAGIAGVLIVPITGLQATNLTLIVIAAMAAAVSGSFLSFPVTLIAGLIIGVAQAEVGHYVSQPGVSDSLPFIAILLILAVRGSPLPVRGTIADRLPRIGSGQVRLAYPAALMVILGVLMVFVFPVGLTIAVTNQLALGIVLISIVIVTGYAGQLSLGQAALAGLGAYVGARLYGTEHWPLLLAIVVAAVVTGVVGLVFGVPALRTRGVNLAVVTLGLGYTIQQVLFNNPDWTGGADGTLVGIPRLFGLNLDPVATPRRYAVFALVLFAVAALIAVNVRRGRAGRRLIAVRANERAAASLGISLTSAKLFAFSLAAAVAGLGGIVMGFQSPYVLYTGFDPITSMNQVSYATIGGVGYVAGSVPGSGFASGGIIAYLLARFQYISAWLILAGGVAVILTLIQHPDGMAAFRMRTPAFLRRQRVTAPSVVPDASRSSATAGQGGATRTSRAELAVRGLTVRFGGVVAVSDVDLSVHSGEIVGLIGPNGAGKTTLIDAVTGFVRASAGTVNLDGRPLNGKSAHVRSRQGIARTFQSVELFNDLTVEENLFAASDPQDGLAYAADLVWPAKGHMSQAAYDAIRLLGLEDAMAQYPKELSYGRRKLVGIARAAASGARILLLDEPAAGLDDVEVEQLSEAIVALAREAHLGIVLVEHDMGLVMSVCDRVVVLDFGRKIAEGVPDAVRATPAVVSAYLGEVPSAARPAEAEPEAAGSAVSPTEGERR